MQETELSVMLIQGIISMGLPACGSLTRMKADCLAMEIFYFPMQKVEKIKFKMSSDVVWPVRESRAARAR